MFRSRGTKTPESQSFLLAGRGGKLSGVKALKAPPKPRPTIKELLDEPVPLTVESLDRLYLNGYVPTLQTGAGLKRFWVHHWKFPVASPALWGQLTKR